MNKNFCFYNSLMILFVFQVDNRQFKLYSKMMLNDDPKGGQQTNGVSFKKSNKQNEENRELKSTLQQLKMELTEKDIKIREMELERYKAIKPLQEQIKTLKNDHKQQLQQQRVAHRAEIKRLTEKLQADSKKTNQSLTKENENLRQQIESQKAQLKKAFQLEMSILRTNQQKDKQAMRIQMQNEKNQALAAWQKKQRQITMSTKQEQESLKDKYETEFVQLRDKSGKEIEILKKTLAIQRAQAKEHYEILKTSVDQRLSMQTQKIRENHQKEKGVMRGSFVDQKAQLESQLRKTNDEIKRKIAQMNNEKTKIVQDYQAEMSRLKRIIQTQEKKIQQNNNEIWQLQNEKQRLSSHLTSYDKSLGFYQEQINQFDSFIQKNNNHLVQQFKVMDDLYPQPSVEKMQLTHLMIKQYKQLIRVINHPIMTKIMNEKQKILSNYVGTQMMTFNKAIDDINSVDFYSLHSEKGKKFARVIQKINLFKSLDSANINDTIDMYFSQKLFQKVKSILINHEKVINSKNDENGQLEFIKNVQIFYELQEFMSLQFPQHKICCQTEYNSINASITKGFNRFNSKYSHICENKSVQKLQDYVKRAQQLKKFVIVFHASKNHRIYSYNLEKKLEIKLDSIKAIMLERLNEDKIALKQRVQQLLQNRVYHDCFMHQRIFKKLKIFDDVLTKEQNSYYNFNFSQLYNKIINVLKIIREEKINLASILLTQQKINVADFEREYATIAFDASIKGLYRQRLKNIMQSRASFINKIDQNSFITSKTMDQFENYYLESLQLNNIKDISDIPQITNHSALYDSKVPHLLTFMQLKFKQYYHNSSQYKQLTETGRNIKGALKFQEFLLQEFKNHHQNLKNTILDSKYAKLPQAEDENQCVFKLLVRLNEQNQVKLQRLINIPEEPFIQEHFDYLTNMAPSLSKYQSGKLQQKMDRYVEDGILQLQSKEWLQGDLNSVYERKLMVRINKLVNKDIAFYRQQINNRKNKIIEERQRIVNSEKRMLKEGQFQKLKQFVMECQKHEGSNSKFSKLYINILQEYLSYVYETSGEDSDKKCRFAETIYKLNLIKSTKSVRQIFKVKEQNLHFYKPDLFTIKDNVQLIEKFQGESQINISQSTQKLFGAFKLYSILKANWDKSLLQQDQKSKIEQEIGSIRYEVVKSYLVLCRSVEQESLFNENCDRRKVLLTFIKIQIYLRLMKKMQTISPQQGYYETIEEYKKIIDKSNTNLQKIFEEIKKFRFYKEELAINYEDTQKVLEHLRRIQRFIHVFKDTKYNIHKLEDYLKNNYLQGLKIKQIDHKQVVLIIEMTWIKEYAVVKKEVADMFSNNNWQVTDKYRLLLIEKELVKQHNLLYFNQFIKQQYDFKKTIIEELMIIEGKSQRYIQQLQKQNQFYNQHIRKLQQNRKTYIQTQKERIRSKYAKLIAEVKNSFHQIQSQKARQKKIQSQINTLKNQQRTEEEKLLDYEVKNIANTRVKANQKLKRWVSKIFYITSIVRNVQKCFDQEIEDLCHRVEGKIKEQMDKQERNIRNEFANHDRRYSNKQIELGSINISQLRATQRVIQDAKSEIENNNQLRVHTEYHEEYSELKTEAVEKKSRSHHDKISSKSSDKYQQKSMINIQAPEESENQSRKDKQQIKVNVIQSSDKPKENPKDNHELKMEIENRPQINNNETLIKKISEKNNEHSTEVKKVQDEYQDHKNEAAVRTVIAIDATGPAAGSMAVVINAFVNIIKEAISQTDQVIKQKNRKALIEHKIIFFRNYNSKYQKIIEQSQFSKDATQLQAFVATIRAEGGLGNQAHEVLFYEIGKLSDSQKIDQIILIGDAAGNKYDQIVKYRKKFSGQAYWSSKVPLLPKIENYIETIKKKQIPIHSMYILKNRPETVQADKNTKMYFQNLSREQNGISKELVAAQASKQVKNFIVSRILSQIGLAENQ